MVALVEDLPHHHHHLPTSAVDQPQLMVGIQQLFKCVLARHAPLKVDYQGLEQDMRALGYGK